MKHHFLRSLNSFKLQFPYLNDNFYIINITKESREKILKEIPRYYSNRITDSDLLAACGWMLKANLCTKFSKFLKYYHPISQQVYLHCLYCNMKLKLRTISLNINTQKNINSYFREKHLKSKRKEML